MYEQQYQQVLLSRFWLVSPTSLVSSAMTEQRLLDDKTTIMNRKRREAKQAPSKSNVNAAPIPFSQNTKPNYPSYCANDIDGNNMRNSQKWLRSFHRRLLAIIVSWIFNRSVVFVMSNTNDVTTLSTHRVQIEGEYNKHHQFKMKRDDFSIPKGLFVPTGSSSINTKELVHHDGRGNVDLARMGEDSLVQMQRRHKQRRLQKENDNKKPEDNKNPEKPEDNNQDNEQVENNRAPPTEDTAPTTKQNTVPSLSPNYTTEPTVSDEDADPPSPSPSEDMATNSTNSTGSMTMQLSEFEIQASVSNDYLSDASNKTIDDLRMAFEEYLEEELLFISLRSIDLELKEAHSTNTNKVEKVTDTSTSKSENVVDGGEGRNNGERVVGSDLRHRNVRVLTFGYDTYNNRRLSDSNETNDDEDNSKNSTSEKKPSSSNETQSNSTVSSLGGISYYRLLFTGSATFAGSVIPDESVLKEEQSFLLINYTEQIEVYMSTFVPNRTVQVERISVMNNDTLEATWTRDDSTSTNGDKSLMEQMSNQTIIIVTVAVIASFFVISALFVVRYKYHRNTIERKKAAKKKSKKAGKDKMAGAPVSSSETSAVDADIRPVKTGSTDVDEENNDVKKSNAYEVVDVSGIESDDDDDDNDNNNTNYSAKYTSPQSKRGGNNNNRFDDNASCGSGSMSDIISVTDWGDHSIGSTITAPRGSKHQRLGKLSDADKRLINGNGTSPDVLNVCSTPTSSTHERMMFD